VDPSSARELLLLVLLVKILVAASIASILARFASFKQLVFSAEKTLRERVIFGAVLGTALLFGVTLRAIFGFPSPDLSLEGAALAGVLGGYLSGVVAGGLAALPAMLLQQELLSMPAMLLAGVAGGFARQLIPNKDDVWHFSPFIDLNLSRWFRQRFGHPRGDWQMFFFVLLILMEAGRIHLGRAFPGMVFYLWNPYPLIVIAICLTTVAAVAIPVTIWKNVRNEMLLEEQRRLLVQARLDALTAQINPHFLFNTLNSISSLIRIDPETARQVIFRLSSILRRLLKKHDNFTALSDELAFIDDYLAIEVIRFGEDKLKIVKEIEEQTLPLMVPSMLLQPIIENAIRHGLSPKVEGGLIRLRSRRENGRLLLEVRDNGVGIAPGLLENPKEGGIGMRNVRERLRVLYGSEYTFQIETPAEGGTAIRIGVPLFSN
jgi:two-component system LytT family sensor kinase